MGNDWTKWLHERAYALWENDNRPDGRHDEHWRQAEEELKQNPATQNSAPANGEEPAGIKRKTAG